MLLIVLPNDVLTGPTTDTEFSRTRIRVTRLQGLHVPSFILI